jgi:hypothetical protein
MNDANPPPRNGHAPFTLDLVHDNPGETPFTTAFNDPATLRAFGYQAKCFQLFDSAILGLNWESVDPSIFPTGSPGRAWVDRKAADLLARYQSVKDAGLGVYCMSDLILLPKTLAAQLEATDDWRDPRNPRTREILRAAVDEMFTRFPQLDGLVVRIGETYLDDAPHHTGGIRDKTSPEHTIIPLLDLLREELCVKRGKRLFFRTWLAFDTDPDAYTAVSAAIDPHPLLAFCVKHCEGDFHRGNRFSRVLGLGRHPQMVEVQCQREYEGKGAHPNYIAEGVINGFEEYANTMPAGTMRSLREFAASDLFAGVWTWSRGGGWRGPYITNELWCRVNAWVLTQWALDPSQSEAGVFARFCREELGLADDDARRFRELCLLSARAVVRGKRSTHADIRPWWSRDQYIREAELPGDPARRSRVLAEKREAEAIWDEIIALARSIAFPDHDTAEFAATSSEYGRFLYRIFRINFEMRDVLEHFDAPRAARLLAEYDDTWAAWTEHAAKHPSSGTIYQPDAFRYTPGRGASADTKNGIAALAARLRRRVDAHRNAPGQDPRSSVAA